MHSIKNKQETLHILLIEDNADDKDFLHYHLRRIKDKAIELEYCTKLSQGLDRLAKGGIDLVFVDLSLPDSYGLNSLTKLHKLAPAIPIVVLTGTDDDELALQALKLGAQDYLVKGFMDPSTLGRSISYAIERQNSQTVLQFLEAVVNGSLDAIIGKSLQNTIVSWNKGAEKIFGYSADEVIGKPIDILIPKGHANDSQQKIEIIKRDEVVEAYESTRITKDGRVIIVHLSVSPILDRDGKVYGVSCIARDITEQKRISNMLRDTDERLKLSIKASKLGLWDWDLISDKIHWDEEMYELYGVTQAQFNPAFESFIGCVHPEDRNQVKQNVESFVSSSGEFDFDFRIVWPDKSVHFIVSKGTVYLDDDGKPARMTGVCFDTTARNAAEAALVASDKRLALALDAAKMGVWDWDIEKGTVWRSLMHDKVLGYDSMLPDWSYQMFLQHVLPADTEKVKTTVGRTLETAGSYNMEFRIRRADDNSIRWISTKGETINDDLGVPLRMLGTITDITEAKHLEQTARQAVRMREQIAQDIVQHAPIGIVILDTETKINHANDAFVAMMHLDLQQILKQPLSSILPTETVSFTQAFDLNAKQVQSSRLNVSIANEKSILQRHWDMSLWPVVDSADEVTGAVLQIVDCTEVVMLEQQREDFVASVAHDIKNPLIGANRMFDFLCDQSRINLPDEYVNIISVLRDGNQGLLSLVQNLIDVYRYDTSAFACHYEDTDLKVLVASCIKQVSDFAQRQDVKVQSNVLAPVHVEIDSIGIRRVITNLLHNAIKFSNTGGKVEVTVDRLDESVRLAVIDTGVGISDADQSRLFQRFGQGAAGRKYTSGTGLGLFLCKQIVEAHNGDIKCQSILGAGTTFVVTLPIKSRSNGH
jgi:PAS domain S-box-containing protein